MLKQYIATLLFILIAVGCFGQDQPAFPPESTKDTIVIVTDTVYSYDSIIIEEYIDEYIYEEEEIKNTHNVVGFYFQRGPLSFLMRNESDNSSIIQPQKVTETNLGFQYGRKVKNDYTLFTGIFFSQVNQQFNFESSSLQNFTYFQKTDTLDISYGDDINTEGFDSIVYVVSEKNTYSDVDSFPIPNRYSNTLNYIRIPVGIAIPLKLNDKLNFHFIGGVQLDFLQKTNDLKLYQVNENYISAFKNENFRNLLVHIFGGLEYEKEIREKLFVSVGGQIATQLGSSFAKHTNLKSNSTNYLINLGIKNYF